MIYETICLLARKVVKKFTRKQGPVRVRLEEKRDAAD